MKILKLASIASSTCVLWCFLPMAVYGCSIHDQLCTFHALGAPHTSYDVKNASTSLNIYAQAENPSAGAARTDFDNNVLLPTNTAISDAISPTVIRPTGPYTAAQTQYLKDGHLPAIWNDSSTLPVHVYPSQYQVTFNQNTAQANHTGDLNGGENGNIPNAMGCPSRENNPDCEAVVITGNVPSGIYSQKIEMFNFYNVSNPSAVMTVGAYATGQGVLIQQSHVDDATAQLGGLPRQLVDLQTTNGKPSNVTSAVNSSFYLAGSKATSRQFDYHFYNRGFDSHAQGTLSFDQKMYHNRGMSQAYQVANHQTGNIDIYRNSLYSIDTKTTMIGAHGGSIVSVRNGVVRAGQAQLVGVIAPQVYCTNGVQSVSCGHSNAVVFDGKSIPDWSPINTGKWGVAQNSLGQDNMMDMAESNRNGAYYFTSTSLKEQGELEAKWRNGEISTTNYAAHTVWEGLGFFGNILYDSAAVVSANLMASSEYVGKKAAQPVRAYLGKETFDVKYDDILAKQYGITNSDGMRTAVDLVNPADIAGKSKKTWEVGSFAAKEVKKEIPYIKKEADYIINWKGLTSQQKGAIGETKEAVDIILNNPNLEFFARQVRVGKDEFGNILKKGFMKADFLHKNKGEDVLYSTEVKTGYQKSNHFPASPAQTKIGTKENLNTSELHKDVPYPNLPIITDGVWYKN